MVPEVERRIASILRDMIGPPKCPHHAREVGCRFPDWDRIDGWPEWAAEVLVAELELVADT
jgi:hypothetical protein